jgi:NAD-dependent dihydropyrimidine dehydrogenase PreA subunit
MLVAQFLEIVVDQDRCRSRNCSHTCASVCPVDIFRVDSSGDLIVIEENVDECVLCELCVQACPDGVTIRKLY